MTAITVALQRVRAAAPRACSPSSVSPHDQQRRVRAHPRGPVRDHRRARALGQRIGDEGVPVPVLARERDEHLAGADLARVDRDAADRSQPVAVPPVAAAASPAVQSGSASPRPPAPRSPRRGPRPRRGPARIVEGAGLGPDHLPGLVALAGDQQHIAGPVERIDRGQDRRRAPGDLGRLRAALPSPPADRGGVLGAGVVVGDDHRLGAFAAAAAPISARLPGSRSPPAPKTTASRPGNAGAARQRAGQRIRRVSVVDIDAPHHWRARRTRSIRPARPRAPAARRTPSPPALPVASASAAATPTFSAWKGPDEGERQRDAPAPASA